ncbi:MAG TPA: hypothetical protein VN370_10680 [Desulfitobacteriaceae bacterium]|nr:hypothetical protein [Desulfitobacteriaceae bacterium]
MELRLGYKDNAGPGRVKDGIKFWPVYLCFIIFGAIIPFTKPEPKVTTLLLSLFIALAVGFLAVGLLIRLLTAVNGVLEQNSRQLAREAVSTGMLFMIPFTVLAVLAQLLLHWDAVMPFASAAIMTAAATAGAEVMKKGATGMKNVLLPSVVAFILSTGWMMLVGLLP